jgi:hypothetical protein
MIKVGLCLIVSSRNLKCEKILGVFDTIQVSCQDLMAHDTRIPALGKVIQAFVDEACRSSSEFISN